MPDRKTSRSLALATALAALLLGAPPAAAAPSADEAALIGLEQAYADALVAKDIAFLKSYYAPDWRGGDWMGFGTKTNIINMLKNSRYVVRSMRLRHVRVRLLGDTAVVQGLDDEVTSMGSKDTSGTWGWTDVFARRNGRWVAVASQTTRIEGAPR